MDVRDVVVIASPIMTVIVAAGTVGFNIFDRRRVLQLETAKLDLERQKIAQEMAKLFLSGSATLERRADLYGRIMKSVSEVSEICRELNDRIRSGEVILWDHEHLKDVIGSILAECRSNQALTNKIIHETVARKYASAVIEASRSISAHLADPGTTNTDYLLNLSEQILAKNDGFKDDLREDLENFIGNVGRLSS